MSILIENVTKYFGNNLVLDNINLEIKTGSLVALLGGSGSGKSTLLRVVAGFEEPSTGRVWLNGKDCSSLSIQDKEIGFVFQTYALFQHLTVYENIAFGLSANNSFFTRGLHTNLVRNWFSKSYSSVSTLNTRAVRQNLPNKHNTNNKFNTYNSNLTQKLPHSEQNFSSRVPIFSLKQPKLISRQDPFKETLVNKVPNVESSFNKTVNFQINKDQTEIISKKLEIKKILNIFNPWKYSLGENRLKQEERISSVTKKDYSSFFSTQLLSQRQVNDGQSYWHKPISSHSTLRSVEELLRLVGLEDLANRYPNQLSGGQCQRVALARALAVQPKVLLLDEPFGALDPKVRKNLRRWLRHLHERVGVTTLFVTHDHQEAMEVATEIVVLDKGRVKHSLNSPQKIFNRLTSGMTNFSSNV